MARWDSIKSQRRAAAYELEKKTRRRKAMEELNFLHKYGFKVEFKDEASKERFEEKRKEDPQIAELAESIALLSQRLVAERQKGYDARLMEEVVLLVLPLNGKYRTSWAAYHALELLKDTWKFGMIADVTIKYMQLDWALCGVSFSA